MGNRPLKVLHVDDYVFDAELIRVGMQRGNGALEFSWAESSEDAISKLDSGEFDCILCDYRLGSSSGLDLLRILRERGSRVPFILVTGHGSEDVASEALRSGADDYYSKDEAFSDAKTLLASIKRLVANYWDLEEESRRVARFENPRERFKQAAVESLDAIWSVSEAMRITYVNNVFERSTGFKGREVVGCPAGEVFPERTLEKIRRMFEREPQRNPNPIELATRCSDGSMTWWEVLATWIETGKDKPAEVFFIARNTTMRRLAQQMLLESNRFMHETLDAVGERIAVVNEHGTILYCNRSWMDFGEEAGLEKVHYSKGGSVFDLLRKAVGSTELWADAYQCLEELFEELRLEVDITLPFEELEGPKRLVRLTAARLAGKSRPMAVVAFSDIATADTTVH